jgi:Eukaryotic aspartyl protease
VSAVVLSETGYSHVLIDVMAVQKTFTVQYDTNSADLFLPHSSCGSECKAHTRYDPSASSTSVAGKQYGKLEIAYGNLYSDTVTIAGLTATSQTFGAVRPPDLPPSPRPCSHNHLGDKVQV